MLKPTKAFFPKFRGISRNGFAESANPFRAFRGEIFVTANFLSLQKPRNQHSFRQAALFRFRAQHRVPLPRQFDTHMACVIPFFRLRSLLRPVAAQTSARRRHGGQGLSPLQAAKMYIFAMLARSSPLASGSFFSQPPDSVVRRFGRPANLLQPFPELTRVFRPPLSDSAVFAVT